MLKRHHEIAVNGSDMAKTKLAIASRGLSSQPSGPRNYVYNLVQEMIKYNRAYEIHVFYNHAAHLGTFPTVFEHLIPIKNTILWDHLFFPFYLWQNGIDIALYPKGTISLWQPCKAMTIMFDLGYFYPELNAYKFMNTIYMRMAMKYSATNADLIFTISENTRNDVIKILHADPQNVITIYGAAPQNYCKEMDQRKLSLIANKYKLVDPFIFYPTSLSPRKNILRVLDAYEKIMDKIPHHLYFTGGLAWNSREIINKLNSLSSERVHLLGIVDQEDMPAVYSLADFSIYPSLFEGLGLPVLEAFQCGSPILVSDQTSLPEIVGEAALIANAYSVDELANGMLRLATDEQYKKILVAKGFLQAKKFTWEDTVARLFKGMEKFELI